MAYLQRTDNGVGSGSAAIDLSSVDATWDITTVAIPRYVYVTVAGDVKFTGADNVTVTWTVPNNFTIPVQVVKVFKTGTTATGLRAIY